MSTGARFGRIVALAMALCAACCSGPAAQSASQAMPASDGPPDQGTPVPRQDGTVTSGRDVFRFETFGNEGFWTDALRVPAGVTDARVTPLQALQLGLSMDIDAVDPSTQDILTEQLRGDPSGRSSALLNDPKMTGRLIKANTVIGLAAKGEKVGVTCALCHTITDGSAFMMQGVARSVIGRTAAPTTI